MHRVVGEGMNPFVDTEAKLSCVSLFKGAKVLDTCCGLGYTATAAAKRVSTTDLKPHQKPNKKPSSSSSTRTFTGDLHPPTPVPGSDTQGALGALGHVTTIEYDEASLEMCAHNPWSQGLFDGTLPITVLQGDSCEIIKTFPNKHFNYIIHDPPARALCRTDLYSTEFYMQLRRVLTSSGTLYHYIGRYLCIT